jgi:hypothetical protein
MTPEQYTRTHKIPVILDLSNLKEDDATALIESLSEYRPEQIVYPSFYALEAAKEMAAKGYPSIARPLPLDISSVEVMQLFSRALRRFNEFAYVRREPDPSRIIKKVHTTDDFVRIIDDMTLQQDDLTLSNIFGTAALKSQVYWTDSTSPINSRLSRTVIPVARVTSKKAAEERLEGLKVLIEDGLQLSQEEERVTYSKPGNKEFRYR